LFQFHHAWIDSELAILYKLTLCICWSSSNNCFKRSRSFWYTARNTRRWWALLEMKGTWSLQKKGAGNCCVHFNLRFCFLSMIEVKTHLYIYTLFKQSPWNLYTCSKVQNFYCRGKNLFLESLHNQLKPISSQLSITVDMMHAFSHSYFVSNKGSFSRILILGLGIKFLSGPLFFPVEAFFSFFTAENQVKCQ
jgi:hypothetical protein